jgi:hypothetical protein
VVIVVTTHCMKEPEGLAKGVPDRRRVDRHSDPWIFLTWQGRAGQILANSLTVPPSDRTEPER